ncbi:EPIDERMAL PATTERNING FACTOR-like protein 1 [Cucurbita pepo subsp. pepo]|uniref:EPIDERMAL PATTERNING FACTOR-like protein 1 n=1 Tax=Cucurbita pepo subsp. pepo TaxID=3664 RepID=UPI000C9D6652|nr:EPIDERMAL PATTERNING FACTOR-like protein 1 [Cucurbita pepo subsp. pepo]
MAMPFLKLPIVLAVFFFIFFFFSAVPPKSVGLILEENMKIGSRPPGCVNKCMSCRPCMAAAAAVVPVHKMKGKAFNAIASSREEVGSYYLLSWKCQCGNKIYQP